MITQTDVNEFISFYMETNSLKTITATLLDLFNDTITTTAAQILPEYATVISSVFIKHKNVQYARLIK